MGGAREDRSGRDFMIPRQQMKKWSSVGAERMGLGGEGRASPAN